MPVDEPLDTSLDAQGSSFAELDRKAAAAQKKLKEQQEETKKSIREAEKVQRQKKKNAERGGIFAETEDDTPLPSSGKAPRDIAQLSKEDKKIEKRLQKLSDRVEKDTVTQFGNKSSFLEDVLGDNIAKNIFSIGKDPLGFVTGLAKAIPFLGGVFAAKEVADFIADELVKIDEFLKRFVDEAERRTDLVRSRLEQANIFAGLEQKIITTAAGSADPRAAYNTFEIFNRNQAELEANFSLSNNSGVS